MIGITMNSVANEHLELGKKSYFEYDRKGALEEFRKANTLDPENPRILGWIAITLARLTRYEEAINIIESSKGNELAEFYIAKGIISDDRDDNKQLAIDQFSKAISIDPNNELAYCLRGFAYSLQADESQAISDLDTALKINASSYVYGILGQIKQGQNNFQGALEDFTKAIELDSGDKGARAYRGALRENMSDTPGALSDYNKAIELDPEYMWAIYKRGRLRHTILGDNDGAMADLNKAIELDPGYKWAYLERGSLREKMGNNGGALSDYNKAIELDPGYEWAWAIRGALRENMGDIQGALADYNKAIELDAEYSWALYKRGTLKHYHLNDKEGALLDYNRVIILEPRDKGTLSQRGQLLAGKGENQEALKDLTKALSIDNNFTHALGVRADLWMSLGKYELALADMAKIYELKGISRPNLDNPIGQEIFDSIYSHLHEKIKPELGANDERFLEFWACILFWGEDLTQTLYKGKQSYVHQGKYGMGYLCLTDRYLRIISLGELSKKHSCFF